MKVKKRKNRDVIFDLVNINNLHSFVSFDGINSYDGRVRYVLRTFLGEREYLIFKLLCRKTFKNYFIKRYSGRINVSIFPLSSDANMNSIEVDSRKIYLVGSDEQFKSQFKDIDRNNKIDSLLS